jgi:iron complex outermembrane receptor protein
VARIDASKWAVTIRGQNHRFSDKLLVLVDGRSLYTREFSGVYWDAVNVLLEDIDRIEVVLGPGGAVWGSNAVNGVINIITKSSAETQGAFVRADLGTVDTGGVAGRYGGMAGAASYRVYFDAASRGHMNLDAATAADDGWSSLNGGARVDWTGGTDTVTLETDVVRTDSRYRFAFPDGVIAPPAGWPTVVEDADAVRASALGRWTREIGTGRSVTLQGFVDRMARQEEYQRYRAITVDGDAKFLARVGRHDLVTGGGVRQSQERVDGSFAVLFTPARVTLRIFNAFAQDELRLAGDRVRLTAGAKVEHDTLSGWNLQPTGRALWAFAPNQRLWGAVSRAVRTPSLASRYVRVNYTSFESDAGLPAVVSIFGTPDLGAERTVAGEAGYRIEWRHLSMDASVFVNHYDGLTTLEPIDPQVETTYGAPNLVVGWRQEGLLDVTSHGLQLAGRWSPLPWWHMDGAYSFYRVTPSPDPASRDETALSYDANAPRHQWSIRPALTLAPRIDVDAMVYHVGRLAALDVPAYTRVDARIEWKVTSRWSVALTGQNLFQDLHAEFGGRDSITTVSRVPRRILGRLTWTLPAR